jgi:hypothetical protein
MNFQEWLGTAQCDESLPADTVELRHPKTGELLMRIVNIGNEERQGTSE